MSSVISLSALTQTALANSPTVVDASNQRNQIAAIERIDWNSNATNLRGRLDQDFSFRCSPNGTTGAVWGTDIYTDDSSICSAAVHAGLITARSGGEVTIRIRPGESFYNGTARNGLSTQRYGEWGGSFIFLTATGAPTVTEQVLLLDWNTHAMDLRGRLGQAFMFDCPSNGRIAAVWGTGYYTDDSSICSAAVHAGLITARNGGRVTITIRPGAESYNGTNRNGVSSQRYGEWGGTFVFGS
jgi:hypothetical protein